MPDAAGLLAELNRTGKIVRTIRATVSAIREDGLVNLAFGTTRMYGVPCLGSYSGRNLGDVVQVLDLGNSAWLVLGKLDGDPTLLGPTIQNTGFRIYNQSTLRSRSAGDAGYEGFVGKGSATDPLSVLAWSYWDGTKNLAVNAAKSAISSVVLYMSRNGVPHGQREAVNLEIIPHGHDTLPSTFVPLTAFTPVPFSLELGELRGLRIPNAWMADMTATTPTIKGFAVRATATTPWEATYAIFNATTAGIRSI